MKIFPWTLYLCVLLAIPAFGGGGGGGGGRDPGVGGAVSGRGRNLTPSTPPATLPVFRAPGDTWSNSLDMKFAYIPAGEFLMGSPDKEAGRNADETQHRVTLSKPFLLGVFEVTQGQWKAVMGTNPSHFTGDDKLPVEEISWTDATNFCQRLSSRDGHAYRLPTEAEWEYACRADTTSPFNTGDTISPDQANYNGKYAYGTGQKGLFREKTTPVGSFQPNAWGLYDMHGNVWEWCADWQADYPSTPVTDPKGPATGGITNEAFRILRGGAFGFVPENCRSAVRHSLEAKGTNSSLGIHVALDIR